jgi:hypothetical protein
MRTVVVNYASGAWYPRGQDRLRASIGKFCPESEFIGFTNNKNFGSPTHEEVPYAFKTFALKYCLDKKYDAAIYADASVWAVKSWQPIWDIIESQGYYFEEAGHWAGTWTKDSVLERMGVTRDEAMKIPMFSAGFTGLDFRNPLAVEFFKKWHSYATDGDSFKGSWNNNKKDMSKDPRCAGHRHDMSVASILAWQMGMTLGVGGTFLSYIGKGYAEPKNTVVAYLQSC